MKLNVCSSTHVVLWGGDGQCDVANMKRLLTYLDLSYPRPEAHLSQQAYNHDDSLWSYMGLLANTTSISEETMAKEHEDEDEDHLCSLPQW